MCNTILFFIYNVVKFIYHKFLIQLTFFYKSYFVKISIFTYEIVERYNFELFYNIRIYKGSFVERFDNTPRSTGTLPSAVS